MKKKPKNPMAKFRSAIRLIWSRSKDRKEIIKLSTDPKDKNFFLCPLCPSKNNRWPVQLATVDHNPPLGALNSIDELSDFTKRMFYGPQRALCSPCHKLVTAQQRRKAK